jgi:hypothetical protein
MPLPKAKAHNPNEATSHQANKTSASRHDLKRIRHLWLQMKNQISTLWINPDWHSDMPLVEPHSPSTRHCFSGTQKSCVIPPLWTPILELISRKTSKHLHRRNESTTRRESIGKSIFPFLETPLTDTNANFFPK